MLTMVCILNSPSLIASGFGIDGIVHAKANNPIQKPTPEQILIVRLAADNL
jgi:hypothetical protein